jgi:hypothetical protein
MGLLSERNLIGDSLSHRPPVLSMRVVACLVHQLSTVKLPSLHAVEFVPCVSVVVSVSAVQHRAFCCGLICFCSGTHKTVFCGRFLCWKPIYGKYHSKFRSTEW